MSKQATALSLTGAAVVVLQAMSGSRVRGDSVVQNVNIIVQDVNVIVQSVNMFRP
jgi:hypothetical protein